MRLTIVIVLETACVLGAVGSEAASLYRKEPLAFSDLAVFLAMFAYFLGTSWRNSAL